jgi:pyruvate,water dikinase
MNASVTKIVYRLGDSGTEADLEEAGGKAASLSRLVQEGFLVPEGFFVSARAYRRATEGLGQAIREALASGDTQASSQRIGGLILGAGIPSAAAAEIRAAYRALLAPHTEASSQSVAVRSSATAEDLPELSFAGQQDTYLDVSGEEAVLEAVLRCWASLWTPRAIDYRRRAGLEGELPSMAVIVQAMVRAESAGVMFTADPVGGSRSRLVVEAVRGLGDALVSGRAMPEHFAVDFEGGGERLIEGGASEGPSRAEPVLAGDEILELARLGKSVEGRFGRPQDIEWARAEGRFFLLQSRPITSLYPLPEDGRPCSWLYSFGAWQGYLEPFTPLGREMMLGVVVGAGKLFGLELELETQLAFREAGERIWVELGRLLEWKPGRAFVSLFLGSIDPAGAAILECLETQGLLPEARKGLPKKALLGLLRFFPKVGRRVMGNLARPAAGRARLERRIEETVAGVRAELAAAKEGPALARAIRTLAERIGPGILPELLGGMVSSQVPFQNLLRVAPAEARDGYAARDEVFELTRSLPHNVTTEMDLALWAAAQAIRADRASLEACRGLGAAELARNWLEGSLPPAAQGALGDFMKRYGFRGTGEIDIGRPRWREEPEAIAGALLSYLAKGGEEDSPEAQFRRGAERAEIAAARVAEAMRKAKGAAAGRFAAFLAKRVRELGGLRESPKFGIVRILGELRAALLAEGARLAAAGRLERASDVFYLRTTELEAPEAPDYRALVAERRESYEREARRRRVPRLVAGDGRAWFDPPSKFEGESPDTLRGSPVSPGVAEGRARVVFDPAKAALESGDILVCPGTDPAWTPLFLAAGALVTEVGGAMTHGSVVAREYGIPAVVGVSRATERIPEGARIRVDGASGLVIILPGPEA